MYTHNTHIHTHIYIHTHTHAHKQNVYAHDHDTGITHHSRHPVRENGDRVHDNIADVHHQERETECDVGLLCAVEERACVCVCVCVKNRWGWRVTG